MKIMVATDGSACARGALQFAAELLPLAQGELVVVSVAPMPSPLMMAPAATMDVSPAIAYDELVKLAEQQVQAALAAARELLGPAGERARYVARTGDPMHQLLDAAHELEPDLIIMGSHGHGRLGRALLGSVSEGVLHRWHGAVMIIRQGTACAPATGVRTVAGAMTGTLVVAPPDMPLRAAARMMETADVGALPVVEAGKLIGLITDRDLAVRALARGADPDTGTVGRYCTRELATIGSTAPLSEAVKLMEARKVRRLPVVDEGQLVGIVALGDLAECAPVPAEAVLVEISKSARTLAH